MATDCTHASQKVIADQMFTEIEKETGLIGLAHCPSTQEAMLRANRLKEGKDGKEEGELSDEGDSEASVQDGNSESAEEADGSDIDEDNPERTPGAGI